MRKAFRISRRDIDVTAFVQVVQRRVRDTAQLHDGILNTQICEELGSGIGTVRSGVLSGFQLAGQEKL